MGKLGCMSDSAAAIVEDNNVAAKSENGNDGAQQSPHKIPGSSSNSSLQKSPSKNKSSPHIPPDSNSLNTAPANHSPHKSPSTTAVSLSPHKSSSRREIPQDSASPHKSASHKDVPPTENNSLHPHKSASRNDVPHEKEPNTNSTSPHKSPSKSEVSNEDAHVEKLPHSASTKHKDQNGHPPHNNAPEPHTDPSANSDHKQEHKPEPNHGDVSHTEQKSQPAHTEAKHEEVKHVEHPKDNHEDPKHIESPHKHDPNHNQPKHAHDDKSKHDQPKADEVKHEAPKDEQLNHAAPTHEEAKPAEVKHAEAKHEEPKPTEVKHAEPKHEEVKNKEEKHPDQKHKEKPHADEPQHAAPSPKHAEPKHADPKPAEPKHEDKHVDSKVQHHDEHQMERHLPPHHTPRDTHADNSPHKSPSSRSPKHTPRNAATTPRKSDHPEHHEHATPRKQDHATPRSSKPHKNPEDNDHVLQRPPAEEFEYVRERSLPPLKHTTSDPHVASSVRDMHALHEEAPQHAKPEPHREDERDKLIAQHQQHIKEMEEKLAQLELEKHKTGHDVEQGRKETAGLRSERDTIRAERDALRTERDTLRSECEDGRKSSREYDEIVAKKTAETEDLRKQILDLEKGKETELDRLKTKLIDLGDQMSNALKFQEEIRQKHEKERASYEAEVKAERDHKKLLTNQINQLTKSENSLKKIIAELEDRLEQVTEAKEDASKESNKLKEILTLYPKNKKNLIGKDNKATIDNLLSHIQSLKANYHLVVSEKTVLTKNLQSVTESRTQLQAENWDLRNLERTLRDKITKLDREINEFHRSNTNFKTASLKGSPYSDPLTLPQVSRPHSPLSPIPHHTRSQLTTSSDTSY